MKYSNFAFSRQMSIWPNDDFALSWGSIFLPIGVIALIGLRFVIFSRIDHLISPTIRSGFQFGYFASSAFSVVSEIAVYVGYAITVGLLGYLFSGKDCFRLVFAWTGMAYALPSMCNLIGFLAICFGAGGELERMFGSNSAQYVTHINEAMNSGFFRVFTIAVNVSYGFALFYLFIIFKRIFSQPWLTTTIITLALPATLLLPRLLQAIR